MIITVINNGNRYQYKHPVSPLYVAKNINLPLLMRFVAARIDRKFIINLIDIISNDVELEFITIDDDVGLNIIRYSCAHLLGYAIKQLWPQTNLVKGFGSNEGFYYDIDLDFDLTEDHLSKLEQKMLYLSNKGYFITNKLVSLTQAKKIFLSKREKYKALMLIKHNINIEFIRLYFHEEHADILYSPQVPNINFCRYFKLYKLSKFCCSEINDNNIILQRVHGIAWSNIHDQKSSNYFIQKNQLLKKHDHRNLASQLDLYHIQEEAPGMIFWHENGWTIFQELKNLIRQKLKQYKYQEVKSPIMMDRSLWKKTGHWDNYYEHIFITTSENRKYCIKPMNCPGHIQIFNQGLKSYKDLPVRIAEFGSCHRNEFSGSLHGLMRIREFTQDDAHIFCSMNQIQSELDHCIDMMYDIYNIFGFKKIIVKLSTRPELRIGDDSVWDMAEEYLSIALKKRNISFEYQLYDGAFYGPKIEFILLDSLERTWQCGTIQLDFSLPNLLNVKYIDNNNIYQVPIIIHRAILGSIERFIGLLIEEYLGFFPTWLAPIQVVLINVTEKQCEYVTNIAQKFSYSKIRVKTDLRNEKIGFKIRLHTLSRIPYILICGNTEMNQGTVSIRTFKGKRLENYNVDIFLEKLQHEINNHSFHQLKE